VRINCVSPGGVLDESKQHPSFIKKYSNKSLLKRLGKPEEMAGPISFLLSDEASFITGHNLMVDGGWTAI
jgi:NAD(P)-dependent dehydrogenase (short-subunit alcohol dehydrogenase family)